MYGRCPTHSLSMFLEPSTETNHVDARVVQHIDATVDIAAGFLQRSEGAQKLAAPMHRVNVDFPSDILIKMFSQNRRNSKVSALVQVGAVHHLDKHHSTSSRRAASASKM